MDSNHHEHEQEVEEVLDLFQDHVSTRFSDLLNNDNHRFLSISWIRKLLDAFLCCEAEFKAVLVSYSAKPPFLPPDRLVVILDLLDRTVKALDVCNAVTHGVETVRNWQRSAEIVVCALEQRPIGEGQVRRAKKALVSLVPAAVSIHDIKENYQARSTERTWSLGRRGGGDGGSVRSPSWSVPKTWSAAKQIQSMSANLAPPRSNIGGGSGGDLSSTLAPPVYAMGTVLAFVMWALVAAIPCQERTGLPAHMAIPRNLGWAQSIIGLQERICEEWKKKEKRGGSGGLMEEVQRMEKLCVSLMEFSDSFVFPVENERVQEIAPQVGELAEICTKMEQGLVPLQQQIREVFHRMVRSRTEVLEVLDQANKFSPTI